MPTFRPNARPHRGAALVLRIVLGLAVAASAAASRAEEGRVPLYKSSVVTESGSYFLSRDVAGQEGVAIRIAADRVTLDLNGRRLSGTDPSAPVVLVDEGVVDVTIRNGSIVGGADGVLALAGTRLRVEDVRIADALQYGIHAAGADVIEVLSCRISGVGLDGVHVVGGTGRLQDNTVVAAGQTGLWLSGLEGARIEGNVVSGHGSAGIVLAGSGGGNRLASNVVRAGGATAVGLRIEGSSRNAVIENAISGNGAGGVVLASPGNRVAGNEIGGNGSYGVRVDAAANLIEGNQVEGNAIGLAMPCNGSRYRNNALFGNTVTSCSGACCTTADGGGNLR